MACEVPDVYVAHVYQFENQHTYTEAGLEGGWVAYEVGKGDTIEWTEGYDLWDEGLLFDVQGCKELISECRRTCGKFEDSGYCDQEWRTFDIIAWPTYQPNDDTITDLYGLYLYYADDPNDALETNIGFECRDVDQRLIVQYAVPLVVMDSIPLWTQLIGTSGKRSRINQDWQIRIGDQWNGEPDIDVLIEGEAPPSLVLNVRTGGDGTEFYNCRPDGQSGFDCSWREEDVGAWSFDLVLTDDEGNRDPWPVELRISRCGCTMPPKSGAIGTLSALALLAFRRRRPLSS